MSTRTAYGEPSSSHLKRAAGTCVGLLKRCFPGSAERGPCQGRKKTRKQLVIVGIIVILVCIGLSGYILNDNSIDVKLTDEEKIVGRWEEYLGVGNASIFELSIPVFFSDGTYMTNNFGTMRGEFELKDGKLLLYDYGSVWWSYDYKFSNNNKYLIFFDENNYFIIYEKQ